MTIYPTCIPIVLFYLLEIVFYLFLHLPLFLRFFYSYSSYEHDPYVLEQIFENKDNSYNIFITKNNEVLPWKKFNKNMAISVEYDLNY